MPMVKKSITVTDQQELWIQTQMATGQYATDSELIREALREKALRMAEVEHIRAKLAAAEQSVADHGWVELDSSTALQKFRDQAKQDGDI